MKKWTIADWLTKGAGIILLAVILLLIGRDNDVDALVLLGAFALLGGAGMVLVGIVAKSNSVGPD